MALEYLTVEHLSLKDIIRIFNKLSITKEIQWNGTSCWVATRPMTAGYGQIYFASRGHVKIRLHRLMYAWLVHPIPSTSKHGEIDHLCRNRACCNPAHLEFVTRRINVLRGLSFAAINARKTHCPNGHAYEIYANRRWCVPCHKERCRKNYLKRTRQFGRPLP